MDNAGNKKIVAEQLKTVIDKLLHITVTDEDANLFSMGTGITSVTMVYLLLELEKEFPVIIDDRFLDKLPSISIAHLADAICSCYG